MFAALFAAAAAVALELAVDVVIGEAAVARVETPWFVDYFHLGRLGDRWVIVNALCRPKPKGG